MRVPLSAVLPAPPVGSDFVSPTTEDGQDKVCVTLIDYAAVHGGPAASKATLAEIIDTLGAASAAAQKLGAVITSVARLLPDQRIYLAYCPSRNQAVGFIKVGTKALYLHVPVRVLQGGGSASLSARRARELGGSEATTMLERKFLCVLDFYTDARWRRQGIGKLLMDAMMSSEGVADPAQLAYDRPSAMYHAFLAKHFGLTEHTPQVNNFLVFHRCFQINVPPVVSLSRPPAANRISQLVHWQEASARQAQLLSATSPAASHGGYGSPFAASSSPAPVPIRAQYEAQVAPTPEAAFAASAATPASAGWPSADRVATPSLQQHAWSATSDGMKPGTPLMRPASRASDGSGWPWLRSGMEPSESARRISLSSTPVMADTIMPAASRAYASPAHLPSDTSGTGGASPPMRGTPGGLQSRGSPFDTTTPSSGRRPASRQQYLSTRPW